MRNSLIGALFALAFGSAVRAAPASEDAREIPPYEAVPSIWAAGGFNDFDVLDEDTLILWTSPFQPYLVELRFGSPDLRFAQSIAVISATDSIYAGFDTLLIAGLRYPIGEIYKLDRDEARQLIAVR